MRNLDDVTGIIARDTTHLDGLLTFEQLIRARVDPALEIDQVAGVRHQVPSVSIALGRRPGAC